MVIVISFATKHGVSFIYIKITHGCTTLTLHLEREKGSEIVRHEIPSFKILVLKMLSCLIYLFILTNKKKYRQAKSCTAVVVCFCDI